MSKTNGDGEAQYIHGTSPQEQARLRALNALTNDAFVNFLRLDDAKTILEVGAGLGILAADVARRAPHADVIGVELQARQLASAEAPPKNLQLVQADANALPFARDTFDVVYCRYLLEHVENPSRVLSEMRRVLRPRGRVFVMENDVSVCRFDPETPSFDHVWARFVELQQKLGGDALIGRRLFSLLKRAGFREVRLSIQPEVHWSGSPRFAAWIDNLAGNVRGAAESLVRHGLATVVEIERALSELSTLAQRDDATAWFHWNRAEATTE